MVNAKITKRTDPWWGRLMYSICILILVSFCLSSTPTYIMGFYHLTDGQHEDSMRGKFFCTEGEYFKYHMAKWKSITIPTKFGGMRIINTKRMNERLPVKWIWKIVNREYSMWCGT
jgi:hypothetical protein